MELTIEQKRALAMAEARLRLQKPEPKPQGNPAVMAMAQGMLGNPYGRPMVDERTAGRVLGMGADASMEGGLGAAGQAIGAMTGPAAPIAVPVLGALGTGAGNYLAQSRRMKMGEQEKFSLGEFIGAGATGLIPGAPMVAAPAKTVLKEGVKMGAQNVVGKTLETAIDEGRLPTVGEAGISMAGGMVGSAVAKGLDTGAVAKGIRDAEKRAAPMLQSLKEVKEAGYRVNPEKISISKAEEVTNKLVRKDVGLPMDAPLSQKTIADRIDELNVPYQKLADASKEAGEAMKAMTRARADAKRAWKGYETSQNTGRPNHELADAAREFDALADAAETRMIDIARDSGNAELGAQIIANRKMLAKAHLADRAINYSRGVAEAKVYGSALEKGVPLDREALTIAKAVNSGLIKEPTRRMPATGVAWYGRWLADKAEMSKLGQALLTNPQYRQRPDMLAEIARLATMSGSRQVPAENVNAAELMKHIGHPALKNTMVPLGIPQ